MSSIMTLKDCFDKLDLSALNRLYGCVTNHSDFCFRLRKELDLIIDNKEYELILDNLSHQFVYDRFIEFYEG